MSIDLSQRLVDVDLACATPAVLTAAENAAIRLAAFEERLRKQMRRLSEHLAEARAEALNVHASLKALTAWAGEVKRHPTLVVGKVYYLSTERRLVVPVAFPSRLRNKLKRTPKCTLALGVQLTTARKGPAFLNYEQSVVDGAMAPFPMAGTAALIPCYGSVYSGYSMQRRIDDAVEAVDFAKIYQLCMWYLWSGANYYSSVQGEHVSTWKGRETNVVDRESTSEPPVEALPTADVPVEADPERVGGMAYPVEQGGGTATGVDS